MKALIPFIGVRWFRRAGIVIVDMSTVDPEVTKRMAELAHQQTVSCSILKS